MKRNNIIAILILAAAALLAWNLYGVGNGQRLREEREDPLQMQIAGKILRFHILANSDSEEDQRLKRTVRDAVGQMMGPLVANAKDLEETEEIVREHLGEIVETAEQALSAQGYDYGVGARLTEVDFPVKTYGSYTFPSGIYEALEITLGKGEGQNWWCVLYPNMCFQGTVYELVDADADEALREVLTPEEYAKVFDSGKVRIRFKFLEKFR